jgi:hypothetical protein
MKVPEQPEERRARIARSVDPVGSLRYRAWVRGRALAKACICEEHANRGGTTERPPSS